MADTRPTPASVGRALRLCAVLLLAPNRIEDEERKDDELRKTLAPSPQAPHRARIVQRAFFSSLGLVLTSALVGYALGSSMGALGRCVPPSTVAWLQMAGASVLLWGTLFIRGWEVQSWGGATLTERVNQWIYRALYCVGTALVVYSLAFPGCRQ